MYRIMVPFIKTHKDQLPNFHKKYPGFFKKWVYSFQVVELMGLLRDHIQENADKKEYKEDILFKIEVVYDILQNKP